jgi:hypothetical protein
MVNVGQAPREHGRVRFESPEVGVEARRERSEAIGVVQLSLRVDGQTERFGVTTQLSLAGKE